MNRREQAFSDEILRLAQRRGLQPANVVRVIADIYAAIARALPKPERNEFIGHCCALIRDAGNPSDENQPLRH